MPTLSEAASLARLAAHGVPVVEHRLVGSPGAAADAAAELGGRVVVKLCGDRIAHKTERSLVRLGVEGPAAATRAAADLLAAAGPDDGEVAVLAAAGPDDGEVAVLVARMVRGTRELIAGVAIDPRFGPVAMLGLGGVLAEAVGDVAFRLLPFDEVDADDLVDDLRTQALLGPFRGEPAVDRPALVAVLVGLGALVAADPSVVAVDVNPLVVVDGTPVAVDALVEVAAEVPA